MRIDYDDLCRVLHSILTDRGFPDPEAEICARIFSENTLVGVSSHGVDRFPDFMESVKLGRVIPTARPTLVNTSGAFSQWDGNYGPGPSNALCITEKVIELARDNGIGGIGLRNTNHWMRPGYYAWDAAEKGYIFICWTNTIPIMPPWGARTPTAGNNPIVFAVPRKQGHIVLDMALAQFSYGRLHSFAQENKPLPLFGGYDVEGNLTTNAKEIIESQRPLPLGYWKGSGFSLLLDLIAAILSGGKSTFDMSKNNIESGASQMFIAIDPQKFASVEIIERSVQEILDYYLSAEKAGAAEISYPGERIIQRKKENLEEGIEVNNSVWQKIIALQTDYSDD